MKNYRLSMALVFFAILLTGFSGFSGGAQSTKNILIPEVRFLRGEFRQTRYLKGFNNPLKSEGRFLVSKDDGLVWQSLKPFPSQIRVDNAGQVVNLTSKQGGDRKPNPGMNKIMHAVVSGDQSAMAKYFAIQRSQANGSWTLHLQPKGGMARIFSHIDVKGDRYVQQVLLEEKSGDKTELRFSAQTELPDGLTAEEKKYFQ